MESESTKDQSFSTISWIGIAETGVSWLERERRGILLFGDERERVEGERLGFWSCWWRGLWRGKKRGFREVLVDERGRERELMALGFVWLWILFAHTYFMDVSTVFDGLSIRIKRLHVFSLFLCHINVGYGSLQRLLSMFAA